MREGKLRSPDFKPVEFDGFRIKTDRQGICVKFEELDIGRKWTIAILIVLGLAVAGLAIWLHTRTPGIPVLVEGTVDIGGFFTDSFDDPIDIGPGEVRLEGRQAEEFWAIITEGKPADARVKYISGGVVTVHFENGKEESVGLLYHQPIVAQYDWKNEIGFWYIRQVPDQSVFLNKQRLRDLLRPCFEETQRKYNEKQVEMKK